MRTLLIGVVSGCVLVACGQSSDQRCEALVALSSSCNTSGVLPTALAHSERQYCQNMLRERLDPDDRNSLAYVAKAAITECSAVTDCTALDACMSRHQCAFLFRGPDDGDPQFSCRK